MEVIAIVCIDNNYGIGKNNKIPWDLSEDRRFFKHETSIPNSVCFVGPKTYDNLPLNVKNCHSRRFIVVKSEDNVDNLIKIFKRSKSIIFLIGGEYLYRRMMKYVTKIIMTRIVGTKFGCDRFFPIFSRKKFTMVSQSSIKTSDMYNNDGKKIELQYIRSIFNKHNEEYQYLNLIQKLITQYDNNDMNLIVKSTGLDKTIGCFGHSFEFDLIDGKYPLITTKQLHFKGIVEELLFFLRGRCDISELQKKGVNIWNKNVSIKYLKKVGLDEIYKEGDMGPGYPHSFRHYNAEYKDCKTNYTDKGIDQVYNAIMMIQEEVRKIQNDINYKSNRRIIIDMWNPSMIHKMVLPPCHILYNFSVHQDSTDKSKIYLSLSLTCRSSDLGLGLPYNFASSALLCIILARLCNIEPFKLVVNTNDTHIYTKHIDPLREQIKREPYSFPKVEFILSYQSLDGKIDYKTIFDTIEFKHFKLIDYKFHDKIKMELIV